MVCSFNGIIICSKESEQMKITYNVEKSHKQFWVKEAWHKRIHVAWFHFIMCENGQSYAMMLEARVVVTFEEGDWLVTGKGKGVLPGFW